MEPKPAYIANQDNPPSLNRQAQQADQLRCPASSPTSPAALPILLPLTRRPHPLAVPVALSSTFSHTGCCGVHARPMGQAPRADSEPVCTREPSKGFLQGKAPSYPRPAPPNPSSALLDGCHATLRARLPWMVGGPGAAPVPPRHAHKKGAPGPLHQPSLPPGLLPPLRRHQI
jgi:hypothetical protein